MRAFRGTERQRVRLTSRRPLRSLKVKEAMYEDGTTDDVLVFLINELVNGSPERRLAAKFILECLRNLQTRDGIAECIDNLEERAILDIADSARQMATGLGLI